MQRYRDAVERPVEPDALANRVECAEQFCSRWVPQGLGYCINQVGVDIGVGQPQRGKPERRDGSVDPRIAADRNLGKTVKGEVFL